MKIVRRLAALVAAAALSMAFMGNAAAAAYSDTVELPAWGKEAVEYVTEHKLMNGVGGGAFDPYGYADRSMVATLIWRMAGSPLGNITGTFSDVPLGQWYSDAIDWAAETGVVTGSDNGKFDPFSVVTRQDLAVMLYRYAGSPAADVTVLSWYTDYTQVSGYAANAMAWAVEMGIINGSGTALMPRDGTTRVQLAAILMRFVESETAKNTAAEDAAAAVG